MTVRRSNNRLMNSLIPAMIVLSLVVLIAVTSGPAHTRPAEARPNATTITLSPAAIAGCDTVTVTVMVNDVAGLYGADVRLAFDPTALEVIDANTGKIGIQVLNGGLLVSPFILYDTADNTAGTIRFTATQLNPTPAVTGTGSLVNILFRAKLSGTTPLTFTFTQLADRNGQTIGATASNGSLSSSAPLGPTLAIAKASSTDARLTWSAATGVSNYQIYRGTTPYFTPIDPPYATTTALIYTDTNVLGSTTTNYYYVIRSACASGFQSNNSNRVGEFDFAITRNAYNTIALPLSDGTLIRADDLGAATGATVVSRWVSTTQSFSSRTVGIVGPNFALNPSEGYFVYTPGTGPTVFTLVGGVPIAGSVHFPIVRAATCRMNLISLPLDQATIGNADTLANAIGGVPVISEWRAAIGGFASRTVGVVGPNFATRIGYPYWPCANTSGGSSTWP